MKKTGVYVAGHQGMVGSAICRLLSKDADVELIKSSREELDLTNQADVQNFFADKKIDQVYLAAAKVGGIHANNTYPAEFIYENLMIEANIIHGAFRSGVKKLLFLGSSCIYPRLAEQPMLETCLLTGNLEPTNEPYAVAKIAGLKMCQAYSRQYGGAGVSYRSVMPTNLYGPGDNYHSENSHVIPALIRRFCEARAARRGFVTIWGSGNPLREFLHVDDLAVACVTVMRADFSARSAADSPDWINVGSGEEISIRNLAELIAGAVGYTGELRFDSQKPDGTPRKILDSTKIRGFGWSPKISLLKGIEDTVKLFKRDLELGEIRLGGGEQ